MKSQEDFEAAVRQILLMPAGSNRLDILELLQHGCREFIRQRDNGVPASKLTTEFRQIVGLMSMLFNRVASEMLASTEYGYAIIQGIARTSRMERKPKPQKNNKPNGNKYHGKQGGKR